MSSFRPDARGATPMHRCTGAALAALALLLGACDLNVTNPNAKQEGEVLGTANGILQLTIGMQDQFASSVDEFVQGPALVTDEWGTGARSLLSYRTLLTGEGVDSDLGVVEDPWADAYRVVRSANDVIAHAPQVGLAQGTATGVVAVAKLFKAMALGTIIQQYQQVLIDPQGDLQPRAVVLDTVLTLLESARADLPNADLPLLRSRILGSGFDLPNTIDAMLARYYLMDGQYQQAIDAAGRVDPGVLSVLPYTAPDQNPIYSLSEGLKYVFPLASFAAEAEPGDQRVAFWVNTDSTFAGNPDSTLVLLNQYYHQGDPFPVYLPDEMKLIRAEAFTRLGDLGLARQMINEVRTQTTSPPVAGLPALPDEALATPEQLLRQIAYERRYELYEQGLRWEDMRRLGDFIAEQPTIDWLPIPRQECLANPRLNC